VVERMAQQAAAMRMQDMTARQLQTAQRRHEETRGEQCGSAAQRMASLLHEQLQAATAVPA